MVNPWDDERYYAQRSTLPPVPEGEEEPIPPNQYFVFLRLTWAMTFCSQRASMVLTPYYWIQEAVIKRRGSFSNSGDADSRSVMNRRSWNGEYLEDSGATGETPTTLMPDWGETDSGYSQESQRDPVTVNRTWTTRMSSCLFLLTAFIITTLALLCFYCFMTDDPPAEVQDEDYCTCKCSDLMILYDYQKYVMTKNNMEKAIMNL